MRAYGLRAVMLLAPVLVASSAGAGETPRAEAFGAYAYGRSSDASLHGWNLSVNYNLGRWLGLEAEVGQQYGTLASFTDLDRTTFVAGPRLSWRAGRAVPYLHALVGGVRTSTGITVQGVSIAARDTGLGGVAGGGVDFALGARWGLRLQADYLMVRSEGTTEGDPRAVAGMSYRFGRRGTTQTAVKEP